jgi:CheY-like chemotaxis protein/REP element-mobilizing transposase RayT
MGIPVLVVDSNVDIAKRIKKSLEADHPFQVTLSTRAIEALMRFTETKYSAVIVDFGLPDLNGADLIRQMRGIDENIIIVAVLDNGESQPKEIERLSINIILDKPAYLSELPQKLAQLLKLHNIKSPPVEAPAETHKAETRSNPDDGAQKKIIQDTPAQSSTLAEEANQPEASLEGTLGNEMIPEVSHPQEAASTEGVDDSDKKVESTQEEPHHEEPVAEKSPHLQRPQEEPSPPDEIQDGTISIPPWLKEPASVEEYMATLKQEHSAHATLLSIGHTPWTYSEQLTENQAHGIVRLLSEHDEGLRNKKALIRYIRLSGTGNDFLLYATPVIGDINLSMIFGMDTPFSVARRQTLRISRLLVEQDPRETQQAAEKPIIDKLVSVSQTDDEPLRPSDWLPGPKISPKEPEPSVTHTPPTVAEEPEGKKGMAPSITTEPEAASLPNDWLPKEPKPASHLPFLDQEAPRPEKVVELEPINLVQQEPKYYLPFTAILLPRFPHHRLTGSLADQLENWLKDLCIAWGWRVDHIDLRSELLRFTISLSPDVAPAQAVQNLANNLSGKILNAFPNLQDDLPSGQFWTKSYLLTAGSDVGKDRLALFIETTRKEQGLVN